MFVIRLPNGNLQVPQTAVHTGDGRLIGDVYVEIGPEDTEYARLAAAGVPIIRGPTTEPWGLTEMWIQDPDGIQIVLVEAPADHPLRRDTR